ncbi:hypothetical protein P691DRAFT_808559 [Macrolepiota fuliginosa MF-IS2]|uniref:Uncharacterized protein n=1 Tax=Macrolepiota fuliginosa MF-IS2 TaxID=1400762 RepID=A0A9P6CAT9_9AGAR|nr:hypothetical protein P691DRAFT_808559 [Macrolepiota fuliginosa MF-IS2]
MRAIESSFDALHRLCDGHWIGPISTSSLTDSTHIPTPLVLSSVFAICFSLLSVAFLYIPDGP